MVKWPFELESRHLAKISLIVLDLWTASLSIRTASSLDKSLKLTSFTCKIISPGSIRPSKAAAPPFMIEPTYIPPSPPLLDCPTMEIPRKLTVSRFNVTVIMFKDIVLTIMELIHCLLRSVWSTGMRKNAQTVSNGISYSKQLFIIIITWFSTMRYFLRLLTHFP